MDFRYWLEFNSFLEAAPAVTPTTVLCPKCKTRTMIYRDKGKYGPFWSCSGWRFKDPLCTGTRNLDNYEEEKERLEKLANPSDYPDLDVKAFKPLPAQVPKKTRTVGTNDPRYFLCKIIGDNDAGLRIGEYIGVNPPPRQSPNAPWEFVTLDNKERHGTFSSGKNIKEIIRGQRSADGNPIESQNIDELKAAIPKDESPTQENPQGKNELQNNTLEIEYFNDEKTQKWSGRPSAESCRLPPEHVNEYVGKIQSGFIDTNESMMVDALAGTGKTRTLRHLSSFIKPGQQWLYLVYNKKNQTESVMEFPKNVTVATTHSFLGQVLSHNGANVGGGTRLPPKDENWKRISKILDRMVNVSWPISSNNFTNAAGERQSYFHNRAKSVTLKMAELAKNTAHDPNDKNIKRQLMDLIRKYAIDTDVSTEKTVQDRDYTPDMIELVIKLMKTTMVGELSKSNLRLGDLTNIRDQDDTLWYAALNADKIDWTRPAKYDVILMDEVQDFNKCQLIMAKKLKETGARVIGVGDPNQSMYLFRGSDSEAFNELKTIIGGGDNFKLPINFRSDGNIIDWTNQNTHVDNLEYPEKKKGKGEVYASGGTHPPIGYETFMNQMQGEWQEAGDDKNKFKQSTCFISRTNAPLGHTALQLLKAGIDFEIVGKDLSKKLVAYIKKVKFKTHEIKIEDLSHALGDYFNNVSNKWGNKIAKRDELKEMEEHTDTLISVLNYLEYKDYKETPESPAMRNGQDFIGWIERKLGGKDPDKEKDMKELKAKDPLSYVTLTTAHKCKGLQWGRVFLMKPDAYDPDNPKNTTEEQMQQERNSWYVAATRAENTLYVSSDDKP